MRPIAVYGHRQGTQVVPEFVLTRPTRIHIPIIGQTARFPVRRIYCVGRNYTAHIHEMGGDEREPPFFFQKPTDAIVSDGKDVPYPPYTKDMQHEVELVLAIGKKGSCITKQDATSHVYGLAVGIDFTRRDVQIAARQSGHPWEVGKAFDHSAPIGALHPLNGQSLPTKGKITLTVNGEEKQHGDLSALIWSCTEIISQLSLQYELQPGDLIYTGTPAGVGPVTVGDKVDGIIEGLTTVSVTILPRKTAHK